MRSLLVVTIVMVADGSLAYSPTAGNYSRQHARDVRILSWNVERNWTNAAVRAPGDRILSVIAPDIILLQEISVDETASDISGRLNAVLPIGGLGWRVHLGRTDGFIRNAIASRYPLSLTRTDTSPGSEVRGLTMALVDLPNSVYTTDLYVVGFHLKAGGTTDDEERRQVYADALISWIRDIQSPGGLITLPIGTPILYGGDANLREDTELSVRVSNTFINGTINDTETFGSAHAPDWDRTANLDIIPRDPFNNSRFTWSSTTPNRRYDRLYVTDSVVEVPTTFILNSSTMTASARNAAGLQSGDTRNAADHLPIVVDLRLPLVPSPTSWTIF
jgi:endonuclease/exonuclease/phosphatase family metal-dependent hydrolase